MTDDNPYQPVATASPISKHRGEGSFTLFFVKLARVVGPALAAVIALGNFVYQLVGAKPGDGLTSFLLAIVVFAFLVAILTVALTIIGGIVGFLLDIVLREMAKRGDEPS